MINRIFFQIVNLDSKNYIPLILIDKITSAIDNGEHIIGLFLDFVKAFDTLNLDILLRTLHHYGIRGPVLQCFQSYLSGRKQTVRISETNSVLKNITSGVTQQSILGPLLFLIYIIYLSAVSLLSIGKICQNWNNI